MFGKYLDDYYKGKKRVGEICQIVNLHPSTFNRYLKKNGLLTKTQWYARIDTGIKELDKTLKVKYCSIINRCNGKSTDYYGKYKDKEYPTICEWADYCNQNKGLLIEMWNAFIQKGKIKKYAISIDRLDNNLGYVEGNVNFVTHGFNSWKRNLNPISVKHKDENKYFMMCEEASAYYGLRRQTIGECLNKSKYCMKGYYVEYSNIEVVLKTNGT